ncbi:universal stress protein [Spirosoma sp. KNUC1025]|uniref:universal stress protein n=1 Tax=Spirosoma sp. KNUC1025 TaxID=2894082 RepID=UPI00386D0197|nr:universal stress protein [Spirosoma sp. KNUC1025]
MPGGCILNQLDEYDPETALLHFAQDKKADLIVLGTHGYQGLRHLIQGSLAEDVANHAPIPVLTLPILPDSAPKKVRPKTDPALIQPES